MGIEEVLLLFIDYPKLIAFVGSTLGGESVILFLSALAGQGLMPLWVIIVFCFLGTVFSDSIWFLIAKSRYFNKIISKKVISTGYERVISALDKISHGKNLLFFIIAKFLYGTRIITIFYLSNNKFSYWKFLLYNSIATVIWMGVMIPIGWLSGKGFAQIASVINNVRLGVSLIVVFLIAFYLIRKTVDQIIVKRLKNGK